MNLKLYLARSIIRSTKKRRHHSKKSKSFYATIVLFGFLLTCMTNGSRLNAQKLNDDFTIDDFNELVNFLDVSCSQCHGGQKSRGGIKNITDLRYLKAEGLIVPGKPELSDIWDVIDSGSMPPDYEAKISKPTTENIDVLTRWILAGAPNQEDLFQRKSISFEETLRIIRRDITSLPKSDQPNMRYLSLVNFYNLKAGGEFIITDEEMAAYRNLVGLALNSMTWNDKLIDLRIVSGSKGTILRFDLRQTSANPLKIPNVKGFNAEDWEKIAEINPYKIFFTNADADEIRHATQTRVDGKYKTEKFPFMRADFFVFFGMTGETYYEILGLKGTSFDIEKNLLGKSTIDILKNHKSLKEGEVLRSGFAISGVSASNRMIERHNIKAYDGAYWLSYDFDGKSGRKNLSGNPVGPVQVFGDRKNVFEHDGGEVIFNLPNGTQAYLLMKGEGGLITDGPLNIVANSRATKAEEVLIRNAISCTECHNKGMIRKNDEIFKTFLSTKEKFDEKDREFIRKVYPNTEYRNNPLDNKFIADSARYTNAVAGISRKIRKEEIRLGEQEGFKKYEITPTKRINSLWQLYERFRNEVSFETALVEVDLSAKDFVLALKSSDRVLDELGNFLDEDDPKPVHRDTFKDIFIQVTKATKAAERGYEESRQSRYEVYQCEAFVTKGVFSRKVLSSEFKKKRDAEANALRKCNEMIADKKEFGFSCIAGDCQKISK